MQYWHLRLHRSVTEIRRFRSGRPKVSKMGTPDSKRGARSSGAIPPLENPADLLVGGTGRFLRRGLVLGHPAEHGGDHERVEDLVDRGSRVSGVTDVRRPVEHGAENPVLVGWIGLRVVLDPLLEVGW